ncbi:MAG: HTH domain-containing protein [FCB group bacterium]|nr:HTH domain-containing protein [FCB group bacterium]
MKITEQILAYLDEHNYATGKELADLFGISRQALNKHIQTLIQSRLVIKEGVTKGVQYQLARSRRSRKRSAFKHRFLLHGLEEHRVFERVLVQLNLKQTLRKNVSDILQFAFTEMLNNAIDHSQSEYCDIQVFLDPFTCSFVIRDFGIGIFHSISQKRNLGDEQLAVGELIKGKTTTAPEQHSGEGIFFTSKCGDEFILDSHGLALIFENRKNDVFLREKRYRQGSEVRFTITRNSRRELKSVFQTYAPRSFDYRFERTQVAVSLFDREYLSRSEARRLLTGLDKFKAVILDFKRVRIIGRGFIDEVFRIYPQTHPGMSIQPVNVSPVIQSMIDAVVDNKK